MKEVKIAVRETRRHREIALIAIRNNSHETIEEFKILLASMKKNFAELMETDGYGLYHVETNVDDIATDIDCYQAKIDNLIDKCEISHRKKKAE